VYLKSQISTEIKILNVKFYVKYDKTEKQNKFAGSLKIPTALLVKTQSSGM